MRNKAYKINVSLYLFFNYFVMVHQDSQPLPPLGPKSNKKLGILLVKAFSLKQKISPQKHDVQDIFWTSYVRSIYVLCLRGYIKYFQLLKKKIKFCILKKTASC